MPKLELPISEDVLTGEELTFETEDRIVDKETLKLLIDGSVIEKQHVQFDFDGDEETIYAKNLSDTDWFTGSIATLVWGKVEETEEI